MSKILTPIKAIRKNCLECCGDSYKEVIRCEIDYCPLYPYRLGKRPKKTAITPACVNSGSVCKQKATRPMSFIEKSGIKSNTRRPSTERRKSKGDRQGAISLSPELTLADGKGE